MKEYKYKSNLPKILISKVKLLKKIELYNLPTLTKDDISNIKSKNIYSKSKLNITSKLKAKLTKKILIKEDSKNNQNQKRFLNKLMKIKNIYSLQKNKSFAQTAQEIAEKNMTNYLHLNSKCSYDMFEGAYVTENENEEDIYNDNFDDISINNHPLSMRIGQESKKLQRNYSQDFITIRNRVLKDKNKIEQYEKLLKNNRYNKIKIRIRNKDFNNLLSSYNAISQNKMIFDNITNNYKKTMVSEYCESIHKLNPIVKMKDKNIHQNIKVFSNITKKKDDNIDSIYYESEEEMVKNDKNRSLEFPARKKLNSQLLSNSLLIKRHRLYFLKNSYQYPFKSFPGSLSEFSITQNDKEYILFGGENSNIIPYVWKFNSCDCSWELFKPEGKTSMSRAGHIAAYKSKNLYVFGGIYIQTKKFADLEIFNFDTKKWISPKFSTKNLIDLRKNHIGCTIGNAMFIHGGIDEQGNYLNDCHILIYQPLQWRVPEIKRSEFKAPYLAYHSCCLVIPKDIREDSTFNIYKTIPGEKLKTINIKEMGLYIFGGKTSRAGGLNKNLYVLRIGGRSLEWIILNTYGLPPKKRYGASMSFYEAGNLLIIHGGRNCSKFDYAYNDTFVLDLRSLNWMKVDYFDKTKPVAKRFYHQSFVNENYFYVFGGLNESNYLGSEMLILDLNSHKTCLLEKNQYIGGNTEIKNKKRDKNESKSVPPVNHL